MTRVRSAVTALIAALALVTSARAAEPPHVTYDPAPPGTVVSNQVVYLAGEGMSSQWRGIVSKKLVGTSAGMKFYQWFLSIYAIDGSTYELKYQSPKAKLPFDTVQRTSDASMWFPSQSGSIVGAADFRNDATQELVVSSHQIGADCGSANLTIFGFDPKSREIVPLLALENYCQLDATIVPGKGAAAPAIQLTGPYYAKNAATCCPTKAKVTATLRYVNGQWVEQPMRYFAFMKP
jgi:hypothetical protein